MPKSSPPRHCPHQILHTKSTPPIPPPLSGAFQPPPPPPPKEKRRHIKHRPPCLENNCTPVVDSSVCDNFNLILILVV